MDINITDWDYYFTFKNITIVIQKHFMEFKQAKNYALIKFGLKGKND